MSRSYISSRPRQLDWEKIDINDIGSRLVARNQRQYLGRSVAEWDLDLEPLPGHFDKRITVTTPLQKAGAYLLTARMEGGNTSRIVVWLDDTVIIKKPLADQAYYFVADARTGQPVPRADVDLFGWRMVQVEGKNEFRDRDQGAVAQDRRRRPAPGPNRRADRTERRNSNGSSPRRTPQGRFAHLGFTNIWLFGQSDPAYNQVKVYTITDRPVYRPGAPVRFKFWVARARYDQPDASEFAGKPFTVEIHNPKGDKVFTKRLHRRRLRRLRRLVRAALRRDAGGLSGLHSQERRRLVPGRGIQEARVRGEGRGTRPRR